MLAIIIYNLTLLILSPIILPVIFLQAFFGEKTRYGLGERIGLIPARKLKGVKPRIWLHAVSVGETMAAKFISPELQKQFPDYEIFQSCTTDTGHEQAVKAVGDRGQVIYFPYDMLLFVWMSLIRVRPRLIVLVETELWPNFLLLAKMMGCKIVMVNGRISERSIKGGQRFAPIYRFMTAQIDLFLMQGQVDADRIIALGADPMHVRVAGNAKFDQIDSVVSLGEQLLLREALGINRNEPVVVAGSTHQGEEEVVLRAFRQVKKTVPNVRLIIAPRQINRTEEISELIVSHGFSPVRRSRLSDKAVSSPPDAVVILDTIGELASVYALSTSAFVGGSLNNTGGHNILEVLALGKPALFGPNMSNFRDIAVIAQENGVGFPVTDGPEIAEWWLKFLQQPEMLLEIKKKTKVVFEQQKGASARCARATREQMH